MAEQDIVKYHLREVLRAGISQMGSDAGLSKRLQAEVKLRLIGMSDEELWELAKLTADPPLRPVDLTYEGFKRRVEELRTTASDWMNDLQKARDPAEQEGMPDKILIIVGEPSLNEKITSALMEAGFSVACVPDYPEALLELCEFKPDLVILDEVLPGRDGIEACSELNIAFGVPVILIGENPDAEIWKRAVDAGADFYFRKPFSCDESLVVRVRAILRRYKGRRGDHEKESGTAT